ncbi:MAG: cupin domain-containing protein [Nitrososphaeraceae archaeon]
MSSSSKVQVKDLNSSPDEVLNFEKEKIEIVNLGDLTVARVTLEPGWSWEKHVKPRVKTNSCEIPHSSYIISGRVKTVMDDGTEVESGPGSVGMVQPGHNTRVVGDEPAVIIDFSGVKEYVKGR